MADFHRLKQASLNPLTDGNPSNALIASYAWQGKDESSGRNFFGRIGDDWSDDAKLIIFPGKTKTFGRIFLMS
jgi:hypothetical protein